MGALHVHVPNAEGGCLDGLRPHAHLGSPLLAVGVGGQGPRGIAATGRSDVEAGGLPAPFTCPLRGEREDRRPLGQGEVIRLEAPTHRLPSMGASGDRGAEAARKEPDPFCFDPQGVGTLRAVGVGVELVRVVAEVERRRLYAALSGRLRSKAEDRAGVGGRSEAWRGEATRDRGQPAFALRGHRSRVLRGNGPRGAPLDGADRDRGDADRDDCGCQRDRSSRSDHSVALGTHSACLLLRLGHCGRSPVAPRPPLSPFRQTVFLRFGPACG